MFNKIHRIFSRFVVCKQ